MDKVISFGKGIRRQPSIGDDGELSELVNLIPKNGELVNVKPIAQKMDAPNLIGTLLTVHKVTDGENYVYLGAKFENRAPLVYQRKVGEEWESRTITIIAVDDDFSVTPIGNVLAVSAANGIIYAIWKDGKYNIVNLNENKFGLSISCAPQDKGELYYKDLDPELPELNEDNSYTARFSGRQLQSLFQIADSALEEYISKQEKPEECFKYVTLGIAALRMYDGSYVAYSDIFTLDPYIERHGLRSTLTKSKYGEGFVPKIKVMGTTCSYTINVTHTLTEAELELVAGVDIFLSNSTPFYDFSEGYELSCGNDDGSYNPPFNIKPSKDIAEEISNMLFSLSVSVDFEEKTSSSVALIRPKGKTLDMSGIPSFLHKGMLTSYNSRLHVYSPSSLLAEMNMDKYRTIPLEAGRIEGSFLYYYDGYYNKAADAYDEGVLNKSKTVEAVIEVDINDSILGKITNRFYTDRLPYPIPPILSYPSVDAKEMRIWIALNGDYYRKDFSMTPILTGNMAICVNTQGESLAYSQAHDVTFKLETSEEGSIEYVYDGEKENGTWLKSQDSTFETAKSAAQSFSRNIGHRSNILKYSNSGNPFVFPALNTTSIGDGEIKGLSTAAKALSQGQFGQFPLYAFCSDGIWALEVASDGSYSAKQPISRDVCNNANSITQIDGAVVFTTSQGLKLIQGSEVVLLSGQMDGHNVDESVYFKPKSDGTKFFAGYGLSEYDNLVTPPVTDDFRTILATSKIAYDYPNRLLRIYPNSGDKWYVYSLDAKEFSSEEPLEGTVMTVIADYPTSLVQINNTLYTFGNEVDSNTLRNGLLLTRPIDMGEPFAMKKLHDMKLHYTKHNKEKGVFVKMVVYVSNDGKSWYVLPSLRKRSFKYYRVALITRMTDNDALSGMVIRYELERTNKLR